MELFVIFLIILAVIAAFIIEINSDQKNKRTEYLTNEKTIRNELSFLDQKDAEIQGVILQLERDIDFKVEKLSQCGLFDRQQRKDLNEMIKMLGSKKSDSCNELDRIRKEKRLLERKLKKLEAKRERQERRPNGGNTSHLTFFFKRLSVSLLAGIVGAVILHLTGIGNYEYFQITIGGIIGVSVYILSSNIA